MLPQDRALGIGLLAALALVAGALLSRSSIMPAGAGAAGIAALCLVSATGLGCLIGNLRRRAPAQTSQQIAAKQNAILENQLVGVATLLDRRILWSNRGLEQLLGYGPGELAGVPIRAAYFDEAGYQAVGAAYPALFAGAAFRSDVAMVKKDGARIWVDLQGKLLDAATGESLWLFADTTARKTAEEAARDAARRLEDALAAARASEARYRQLAEDASDMIATMAPDSTVLFVTPSVHRILGYTPDEIVGRKTLALTHPDDVPATVELFKHLIRAGVDARGAAYEFRAQHKDGRWVWLEGQPRIEFDADGAPVAFQDVVRDVTRRKQAEAALQTSRSLLERTSKVAGVGGWQYDLASGELLWSDETCRLLDVSPGHRPSLEEALGYYPPEARTLIAAAVESGIEFGTPWDLELPVVSAAGRSFWARAVGAAELENGRPVRLIGAFQDISEQRRMARQLAESHELLKVTLDSIGDAVITADADDRITWLNPVAERLTGWSNGEARGQDLVRVFNAFDEAAQGLASIARNDECQDRATKQMRLVSRDGAQYGIEGSVSPLRDGKGEVLGLVLAFRDVSDRRRANREVAYRATHDLLTDLLNRAEFEARLDSLLARREPASVGHAIMFIDLDRFKAVNDCCGHARGDRLLRQIGKLLGDAVRSRSTASVARLGGDEFSILLEDCTLVQAAEVACEICRSIKTLSFLEHGDRFEVGASIGLVQLNGGWTSASAIMHAADMACYAAKKSGRNRVHIWTDGDGAVQPWAGPRPLSSQLDGRG